ncbi:pyridoxal phosphate-dependent transferase [Penicillium sp. DV-2018c]|nr:pyridoxal phosphate-dependent transferase [Penicillium sp. DV-2018c]KAJ5567303.1 pyridoxal phosphate-dependent transferase [Penicillium sp. DV-2018c]
MGSIPKSPADGHVCSLFSTLQKTPPDEPFSVNGAYKKDCSPHKVNLGIGVYRTPEGNPWPLPVVEEAENQIHKASDINRHEYSAIQGDAEFLDLAADLAFGFGEGKQTAVAVAEQERKRVVSIQTVSGTGANRLGAELLARNVRPPCVWIPDPTWANHYAIWELAGVPHKSYPYYDASRKSFNFEGTFCTLEESASEKDVVILHACAHNPTGADPTQEQWKMLARLCKDKGLIPFFDLAYQGFASGDAKKDAWAIRHFFYEAQKVEFCVAQSFSKNFGLYGQRVGALHVVLSSTATEEVSDKVLSNLCHLVRGEYSMAPRGGAEIVKRVLGNDKLRKKWQEDLTTMSQRIQQMRHALFNELSRLNTPGEWTHVINQIGMFSYIGLTEHQVKIMTEKHHIYMLKSGRISISGLNQHNVRYVAMAIDDVVRNVK